ncbi:MAG: glycosyltransferase [Bacteroidales bacterium]|nr:glycosyltransferase [Bacteroidales bacterium]MBR4625585.1 glycosyltransferase [Alphaproteobacteria bacterium]
MKVSIITACYNRSATITTAIRSVFAQDYPDIEYILVDGASTDGSQKVIEETLTETPKNVIVKYISEPDHGMYEAINKGIKMATGDVIALCHSDDCIYDEHVVSDYVKEFGNSNADFIYADGVFVQGDKLVRVWKSGQYSPRKVRNGWLPLHPTCYIKKTLFDRLGLYDESYKIAADTDLLVRYLLRDDVKVAYLSNRNAVKMSMGGLSTDSAKRKKVWDEDVKVYSSNGFRFPTITKMKKVIRKIPQFILAKI